MGLDRVDSPNAVADKRKTGIAMCRDIFAGTEVLRKKRVTYLPMFPGEKRRPEMYEARLQRSVLFNGFQRTVHGLLGMIFRVDPALGDDVPASIAGDREDRNLGGDWENIDLQGTHGDVFLRERIALPALVQGLAGILVDFPPVEAVLDSGTERALRLRPYWVPIEYHQVVSFRTATEYGRVVLTQLVLRFDHQRPDGTFGEKSVKEYRVYRRDRGIVSYEVWEGENSQEPTLLRQGVIRNQTEIPVAWCYGGPRDGMLDAPPPLQDLGYTALAHLETRSDHRTSMHYASQPIPVFIGVEEPTGEKVSGSGWAEYIPVGGDFKFVEHAGSALAATRQELEDLKAEMATLGLAMLQRETRAAETAEGKRIDKSASDSALAAFARGLQDCVEQALHFHALYRKEADGGSIEINRDFEALRLEPADVQALSAMVAAGQLSLDTMWQRLIEGEWLRDDFNPEEEKERIAAGGMVAADLKEASMTDVEAEKQMAELDGMKQAAKEPAKEQAA